MIYLVGVSIPISCLVHDDRVKLYNIKFQTPNDEPSKRHKGFMLADDSHAVHVATWQGVARGQTYHEKESAEE